MTCVALVYVQACHCACYLILLQEMPHELIVAISDCLLPPFTVPSPCKTIPITVELSAEFIRLS